MTHTHDTSKGAEAIRKVALWRHSAPAQRALGGAGYTSLNDLTKVSETELLDLHGMGPKGIRQLREALAERGLSFAEDA